VVDHYERDAAFETACRSWARRLAAIDDLPGRPHVAPCVIDPGAGLTPAIDTTRVHLAGPAFALLDPAFAGHRRRRRTPSDGAPGRRIFIAMGGGDVADITEVAVRVAANRLPEAEIDVVVGSGCDGHERLTSELAALGTRIRLHKAVAPTVIADMMKPADIGIGAAGTMTWERCCLGL